MALFYNCFPQFEDINGDPYASGKLYFGDPNTDPKTNPKTVWLNDENTAPAANPQPLNSSGVPSQGQIYLEDGELYSVELRDANDNFVAQAPAISGIYLPVTFGAVPPVVVQESVTVESTTSAQVIVNSGVVPNAVGEVLFQEAGVSQFAVRRKAIVDGGALSIVNISAGGAEEVELPLDGGVVLRNAGQERLSTTSTGVNVTGDIGVSPQVAIAYGKFTAAGAPIGQTVGIVSAGPVTGSPTGEYEVVLTETPTDETNLAVDGSATLAGAPMNVKPAPGPFATGTALISTYDGTTNAAANCDEFTIFVYDAGRD